MYIPYIPYIPLCSMIFPYKPSILGYLPPFMENPNATFPTSARHVFPSSNRTQQHRVAADHGTASEDLGCGPLMYEICRSDVLICK